MRHSLNPRPAIPDSIKIIAPGSGTSGAGGDDVNVTLSTTKVSGSPPIKARVENGMSERMPKKDAVPKDDELIAGGALLLAAVQID